MQPSRPYSDEPFRLLLETAGSMQYDSVDLASHEAFGFDGQVALSRTFGDHSPLLREWQNVSWLAPAGSHGEKAHREAFERARLRSIGILEAAIRALRVSGEKSTAPALSETSREDASDGRAGVFISYSSKDRKWLARLNEHLAVHARRGLRIWTDENLRAGDRWHDQIQRALNEAQVAVLLVTPSFLASPYIQNEELPRLLAVAELRGLTVFWIPISASQYKHTELRKFQAAWRPDSPLDTLRASERNSALVAIVDRLAAIVSR